jgi:hypothetical protein
MGFRSFSVYYSWDYLFYFTMYLFLSSFILLRNIFLLDKANLENILFKLEQEQNEIITIRSSCGVNFPKSEVV